MKQSREAQEMLDLMDMAEQINIIEAKIDRDDVVEAAWSTAKEVFGDKAKKKVIMSMVANAIEEADTTAEAIEIVQNMMRKNEETMVWDPNSTKGPGAKTYTKGNVYTRDEVVKMLDHAKSFVKNGKQPKSWNYSQDWLNMVGNAMAQFTGLRSGDPALEYEPGDMKSAAGDWDYDPNDTDKGSADASMAGSGPGPQRSKRMSSDYSPNKRAKGSSARRMKTDYNK